MLTMDPATLLPTGEVVENGLPPEATARMTEIEMRGEDVNAFVALAARTAAASLSEATDGDLDRSRRHREVRRPHGFGDELRATLVDDAATWGGLTLLRASDREPFTPADADARRLVAPHLAEGLRRAMLLGALSAAASGGRGARRARAAGARQRGRVADAPPRGGSPSCARAAPGSVFRRW